jgi:hypothetical protein
MTVGKMKIIVQRREQGAENTLYVCAAVIARQMKTIGPTRIIIERRCDRGRTVCKNFSRPKG